MIAAVPSPWLIPALLVIIIAFDFYGFFFDLPREIRARRRLVEIERDDRRAILKAKAELEAMPFDQERVTCVLCSQPLNNPPSSECPVASDGLHVAEVTSC